MRRTIILFLVLALLAATLVASGLATAWAKSSPLKIFINEKPSTVKATEVDGVPYVPVYFPAEKGTYEIKVSFDKTTNTMRIEKKKDVPVLRGDHNCERCSGSGKCQSCYPVGSGKSIQDESCSVCNGTGSCGMCNGSGKY